MPERHRVAWAAHAGAILAVWLSNDWKAMMQTLAKANGRLGGMASAKIRKNDALNKADVVLAVEKHGWPDKTKRGLLPHLAKNFHCSPDYVGEILSAEKKHRV